MTAVDITEMLILTEPRSWVRLHQLGFCIFMRIDEQEQDKAMYVLPPIYEVPSGSFLLGTNKAEDFNEAFHQESFFAYLQHEVLTEAYAIGRYPVTVAEYACAVRAGVINAPQMGLDMTWQQQLQEPDFPVVGISWFEAQAYAVWLTEMTQLSWRLPTEAEWKKAFLQTKEECEARWGKDYWRIKEVGEAPTDRKIPSHFCQLIGKRYAIGEFDENDEGIPSTMHDRHSTVFEWTHSLDLPYPYSAALAENESDTHSARRLCGTSSIRIHYPIGWARGGGLAAPPPTRYDGLGFRLVRDAMDDR